MDLLARLTPIGTGAVIFAHHHDFLELELLYQARCGVLDEQDVMGATGRIAREIMMVEGVDCHPIGGFNPPPLQLEAFSLPL